MSRHHENLKNVHNIPVSLRYYLKGKVVAAHASYTIDDAEIGGVP